MLYIYVLASNMLFFIVCLYYIDVVLMSKKVKCACSIQDENDNKERIVCKYEARGLQRNLMLVIICCTFREDKR